MPHTVIILSCLHIALPSIISAQLNISRGELDTLLAEDAATNTPAATDTPADVWAYMKRQLHKRYPDLINIRGSVDMVKQALADALCRRDLDRDSQVTAGGSLYLYSPSCSSCH